uniref:Uncharacterized LOC107598584 n=1 Tax=Sinocyclocheilus grahami TaxID=75366 RepID=A0A672MEQ9_SINGR
MLDMIMGSAVAKCAITDLAIQWVGWALASALKTEKFYDLAVSPAFCCINVSIKVWLISQLVTDWALSCRLGTFLFLRILKEGQDRRFDNVRDSPGTFFVYWTMQALWVFITLLPTLSLNSERRDEPLGPRDYIGWGIWGLGFATEAIADRQKWNFRSDPDNAGKFIHHGLWAYSRHPNYLGEILQWSGLFLSASSVMRGPQYLTVVSPLFVWFLLRHVSGIPILEKQTMKKWGSDPAYQNYIKNTPLLWPFPKFKGE